MYSLFQYDAVERDGENIGISHYIINSANARKVMSIAVVNVEQSKPGTELTLHWGEPDSKRPTVEKHSMRQVRVTVAPAPYYEKQIADDKAFQNS